VKKTLTLSELKKGVRARIISVNAATDELTRSFLEIGILEGSPIRVVHQAPFGGDPIAVEVRGALIALRRQEAAGIDVELEGAAHEHQ